MSFGVDHKSWMCDRCELNPKMWKVPFMYLDRNDKIHPNLGNDYHHYEICDTCKKSEVRKLKAQGKDSWNMNWIRC